MPSSSASRSPSRSSQKTQTPSLYTTNSNSTTSTTKPLINSLTTTSSTSTPSSEKKTLWHKTKSVLSSVGEPPTASYDRKQAALGNTKQRGDGKSVNYGLYNGGGPYAGSKI